MSIDGFNYIDKPFWLRLLISVTLVAAAVILAHGVWLIVDRPINSPLFLAVMILCSWLFGLRVGVLTAIISGIAISYFFVPPFGQLLGDRQDMVRITVFVVEGIFLGWLIHLVRLGSEKIRESSEKLRALTEHQRTLREDEQKRISLEIHDELGQELTGLKINLHNLKRRISGPKGENETAEIQAGFDEISKMIDGTISSVRRIASELRPSVLDDFGLIAAIDWQVKDFENRTRIEAFFRSDTNHADFDGEALTAIFRILQEALTNVARHADATKVNVEITDSNKSLTLEIRDNGMGIGSAGKFGGLGLLGMEERARLIGAVLKIRNAPGGGTIVRLTVPKLNDPVRSEVQEAIA
jgi:signal transduction histidine kinase